MNKRSSICFVLFLLIPCQIALAAKCNTSSANPLTPVRKLYVVAGQSNAAGLASVDDVSAGPNNYFSSSTVYPQVKVYGIYGSSNKVVDKDDATNYGSVNWSDEAQWEFARPGFGSKELSYYKKYVDADATASTLYRLFGPELGLSASLARQFPYEHYIVKLAIGGTNLSLDWKPGGYLYNELMEMVADAYNSKRSVVQLEIAGIFWMQGESDALNVNDAANYQGRLSSFVDSVRNSVAAMGCPVSERNFPIIVGRIQDNSVWTYRAQVRAAQQNVGLASSNIRVVDTDDFTAHMVDGIHFNEFGQALLGTRVYRSLFDVSGVSGSFDANVLDSVMAGSAASNAAKEKSDTDSISPVVMTSTVE